MSGSFVRACTRRSFKLAVVVAGVFCILQSGGCALRQASPPHADRTALAPEISQSAAPIAPVDTPSTVRAPVKTDDPVAQKTAIEKPVPVQVKPKRMPVTDVPPSKAVSVAPVESQDQPTQIAVQGSPVTKTQAATAKPSAPIKAAPAPSVSPPPVLHAAAGQYGGKKAASLDLNSLETRLRQTSAIGVFTKLALKNQVNDLLDKFRAYYQGGASTTLAQLRQPYDMLIMKVLALIQNNAPPLAKDIQKSREAIWNVLADPKKFATATRRI